MQRLRVLQAALLCLVPQGLGCSAPTPSDLSAGSKSIMIKHSSPSVEVKVTSKTIKPKRSQREPGIPVELNSKRELMPSQAQICNSDELLLSVYEFDALYGTPLPRACCTEAIRLKAQWRCELDWPSSDVPSCASLTDMADRLTRFIDTQPKWYTAVHRRRALVNAGRLRSLSVSKGDCVP